MALKISLISICYHIDAEAQIQRDPLDCYQRKAAEKKTKLIQIQEYQKILVQNTITLSAKHQRSRKYHRP